MKRKVFSLLMAGIMAVSILATGCGASASSDDGTKKEDADTADTADTETVKLRLMSISTDGIQQDILNDYIKKNLEAEFPNVEVEFEAGGGGEDMCNKLKTYSSTGDLPDVWYSTADSAVAIIEAGNMQNLEDAVTADGFLKNYALPDALNYKGEGIYTLSSGADTYYTPKVYYRKDVFEQNGLDVPQTFDEWMDICETLKQAGEVPITLGGKGGWTPQYFLIQQMIIAEDPQVAKDILENKADFSNPVVVNAANRIIDMVKNGYIAEGASTLSYSDARELFKAGRAAMLTGWSWDVGGLSEDENIGIFNIPSIKAENTGKTIQYWGSPLNGYAVNPNSEHLDVAIKFAEYCVSQEALYHIEHGNMVNLQIKESDAELSDLMKLNRELYDAAELYLPTMMLNCMDSKVNAEFASIGSKLLTSDYSGEEFAEEFNAVWKENTWFD